MSDVYTFGKKLFTLSVVAVTIAWSMGLAALVPAVAHAEECPTLEAGDLFRVPASSQPKSVYLVTSQMKRRAFPYESVYKSYYKDFSNVKQIGMSCTDAYPSDGFVTYRPGSALVKSAISNSIYAILPGGELTKLGSPTVAAALYGADWEGTYLDLPDIFFDTYTDKGSKLETAMPHNGMLVKVSGGTDVYYVSSGKKYKVDGALSITANSVETVSQTVMDSVEAASTTVTEAEVVSTVSASAPAPTPTPTTTTTPVVGGSVAVSLSANTPPASNVVINIDNVVFTKVILKAGDKDATVNAVKIDRKGLGSTGDFASSNAVTLYDGTTKLGSSVSSWHSDGYMIYNVAGGWKIPANTSKELTIVAKLDTASSFNALGVSDLTLASGGTASGMPVYGNQMSGVSVAVGGVTISNMGASATKKIGTTEVTLANFKLTVSSTEDGTFKKITLKNKAATSNAADGDLANMSLYMGTKKLAGPVSMVSDKITFVLEESVAIAKSKNEVFKVVGDVINGDNNTVEFVLDATTDLEVTGKTYGTSLTVHSTSYDAATEGMIVTIDGAELNLSYTGTNMDTIDDKTDVAFGTLTLSAGSTDIKITTLKLTVDETNGDSDATNNKDVDNFEMVDNSSGGAYSGTMTGGGDTDADDETWTFSDEIYLTAGQTRTFALRGDLPDGIGSGDSYKVTATINTTNVVAETVPAGDAVSNFSIGSFTGKTITVKSPTLKVAGTTLNGETHVVNDENVVLYKGTLEAQADDIKVTYADFNANTTFSTANWTEVGFYTVDATGAYVLQQNLTSSQMSSSTSNSGQALAFDSLDLTIKNGAVNKVTFVVKGKVASSLNSNTSAQIKLDYFTGKASDNSNASVTSGSDDLSTADSDFLTAGGAAVTLASTGNLKLQMRSTDTGFSKDRIVLAGSSAWVGKLKLIASNEDVKIKDLKLTNVTDSVEEDSVSTVCLYRAQAATAENLISCQTMDSSSVVFFDDIDEVVKSGTAYWYIYLNTPVMTDGATGTADSHDVIQLRVTTSTANSVVAEGVRSGDTYTISDDGTVSAGDIVFDEDNDDTYDETDELDMTTSTTKFIISGTKISNVSLLSKYPDENPTETVNTVLSGTGEYTAAILAVTTEASSNTDSSGNTLKTLLTGIRFDVDKFASTSISGVTIKKIGGLDTAGGSLTLDDLADTTSTAGTALNADLATLLPNDHKIDPGTTSYYVVKATLDSLNAGDNVVNWFRFDLDDVKGTYNSDANESITWKDGSSSTAFQALLLDTENITGTKVAEAN
ncbi:MAG: hypothetical protein HYV41_04885 [Candidatus Magasanikbacteria bacterium]|nr:hypothetical protein [Candidatus Magasanikbacteria bacterium]